MNQTLEMELAAKGAELNELCTQCAVASIDLFGSGVTDKWNPLSSDLDFIVSFSSDRMPEIANTYPRLAEGLEKLFGRRVDLITDAGIKNPFFRASVNSARSGYTMPHEVQKPLYHVITAANAIRMSVSDRSRGEYLNNLLLRSACERQLEIIREAIVRVRDRFPEVLESIPEAHRVIGLRNRLIHGYDAVDDAIVRDAITTNVPILADAVKASLGSQG